MLKLPALRSGASGSRDLQVLSELVRQLDQQLAEAPPKKRFRRIAKLTWSEASPDEQLASLEMLMDLAFDEIITQPFAQTIEEPARAMAKARETLRGAAAR